MVWIITGFERDIIPVLGLIRYRDTVNRARPTVDERNGGEDNNRSGGTNDTADEEEETC